MAVAPPEGWKISMTIADRTRHLPARSAVPREVLRWGNIKCRGAAQFVRTHLSFPFFWSFARRDTVVWHVVWLAKGLHKQYIKFKYKKLFYPYIHWHLSWYTSHRHAHRYVYNTKILVFSSRSLSLYAYRSRHSLTLFTQGQIFAFIFVHCFSFHICSKALHHVRTFQVPTCHRDRQMT